MPVRRDLFTIGEFSSVTGVGIHSLRYYDEIGALKPEYVDPVSNYRYYGFDQLRKVPCINICLDAGIKLSEFGRFVEDDRINYEKLLSDSREAIDRKIEACRKQQEELERIEIRMKLMATALSGEIIKVHIAGNDLCTIPFEGDSLTGSEAEILVRLSTHAKKHGCQISPVCFGLMQTAADGVKQTYAFASIDSISDQAKAQNHVTHLGPGTYLIKASESCSIRNASALFPETGIHCDPDLLSFFLIGDRERKRYCFSAAKIPE